MKAPGGITINTIWKEAECLVLLLWDMTGREMWSELWKSTKWTGASCARVRSVEPSWVEVVAGSRTRRQLAVIYRE